MIHLESLCTNVYELAKTLVKGRQCGEGNDPARALPSSGRNDVHVSIGQRVSIYGVDGPLSVSTSTGPPPVPHVVSQFMCTRKEEYLATRLPPR